MAAYEPHPEDLDEPEDILSRTDGIAIAKVKKNARDYEAELRKNLNDPHWRIRNLYWIRDKEGKAVKFKPWPEQEKFIENIWFRNIVPKARQRGFSTVIQLLWLDTCLFNDNMAAAVIAQDDATAKKIFDDKILFAWERMPDFVRRENPTVRQNTEEMKWKNGSYILVSTSTRGNTIQRLHVSELGQIAAKFPERAKEIQRGSLASVDKTGIIVIESTVESPTGIFSEMVKTAVAIQESGKPLSKQEYKLHFASWWDADEYEEDPDLIIISPEEHEYFDRIEGEIGRSISMRKRAWYIAKLKNDYANEEDAMWSQYPSTLKEAFQVSSAGIWFSKQLSIARKQKRIGTFNYDPRYPVNTWWDIGVSDDIAIIFHQKIGLNNYFINFIEGSAEPYNYFVRKMNEFGYVWGSHYLPHDANQRRPGAEALKTPADMLEDLKLRNLVIVPRISEVHIGIDQTRLAFHSAFIDDTRCKKLIEHLEGYEKSWNERSATWSEVPRKNGHQHAADAFRQWGQLEFSLRASDAPPRNNRPTRRNRRGMAS